MLTTVVRVHTHGDADALMVERLEVGDPGPGEVRLRQTAIGLNFIDTYHRSGLYPLDKLPAVLGSEAAGVVEAVGAGVDQVEVGDRVTYALALGAYAARRLIAADRLVPLPDLVSDRLAAAVTLKGLTAFYLLHRTRRVTKGDTILVHAAAGGVGSLLCQWARALGARVLGTVGSDAKAELAAGHGCDEVILYTSEDVVGRVRELTAGRGVDVVYDGVGKSTFDMSLECLARFGLLVSFGNASGPVPPLDLLRLSAKGVFVTRPSLRTYVTDREEMLAAATELFGALSDGTLRVVAPRVFELERVREAHRALEGRETTGSSILVPGSSSA